MKSIKSSSACLFLLVILFSTNTSHADWVGPTTVFTGSWGHGLNQFGFRSGTMKDKFPDKIHILPDDSIIVEDVLNLRFKIFTVNGEYSSSFGRLFHLTVIDRDKVAGFYWDARASKPRVGVYSITQKKWLWYDKKRPYNFITSRIDVVGDEIYAWNSEENKGYNYAIDGKLLRTYMDQPLELGIKSTNRFGSMYKTVISYPDAVYTVYANEVVEADYRDDKKFLYYIKNYMNTSRQAVSEVYRYDLCGKQIGSIQLPVSSYEPQTGTDRRKRIPVEEYGEPVISHTGDVYIWARTKKEYKILRWTWVDRQSDLMGGPDIPSELLAVPTDKGIFLSWNPAPQDPGCVKSYEILRASSESSDYGTLAFVPGEGKLSYLYEDNSATGGARWYYRIRSLSDIGNSKFVEINAAMP